LPPSPDSYVRIALTLPSCIRNKLLGACRVAYLREESLTLAPCGLGQAVPGRRLAVALDQPRNGTGARPMSVIRFGGASSDADVMRCGDRLKDQYDHGATLPIGARALQEISPTLAHPTGAGPDKWRPVLIPGRRPVLAAVPSHWQGRFLRFASRL
jgi:hypothetical protein